jgi:uncharacterized membrane protein
MLNAYNINIKTEGLKMLDYLDGLNHFEMMLVWLILLSVIFIIIYLVDKKNKVSNEDILKKRLARGELSIEEFRTLIDEL